MTKLTFKRDYIVDLIGGITEDEEIIKSGMEQFLENDFVDDVEILDEDDTAVFVQFPDSTIAWVPKDVVTIDLSDAVQAVLDATATDAPVFTPAPEAESPEIEAAVSDIEANAANVQSDADILAGLKAGGCPAEALDEALAEFKQEQTQQQQPEQ